MTLKTLITGAMALALAASLSSCASGLAASDITPGSSGANLDTLKEANRHLELCDRTYTLSWPPSGIIHCPVVQPASAAPLSAADIASIVSAAVAKALASLQPTPPSK